MIYDENVQNVIQLSCTIVSANTEYSGQLKAEARNDIGSTELTWEVLVGPASFMRMFENQMTGNF